MEKEKRVGDYVNKNDIIQYKINPWINTLATTIKKGSKITGMGQGKRLIDASTGELLDSEFALVSKQVVDKEIFVKMYEGAITSAFDLSGTARNVFKAIMKIYLDAKFTADKVYVSKYTLEEVGYIRGDKSRISGLNQLAKAGFIAPIKNETHWYWINPNMFYKGNRMTIVQQYAISGTPEAVEIEEEQARLESQTKQQTLPFSD